MPQFEASDLGLHCFLKGMFCRGQVQQVKSSSYSFKTYKTYKIRLTSKLAFMGGHSKPGVLLSL